MFCRTLHKSTCPPWHLLLAPPCARAQSSSSWTAETATCTEYAHAPLSAEVDRPVFTPYSAYSSGYHMDYEYTNSFNFHIFMLAISQLRYIDSAPSCHDKCLPSHCGTNAVPRRHTHDGVMFHVQPSDSTVLPWLVCLCLGSFSWKRFRGS